MGTGLGGSLLGGEVGQDLFIIGKRSQWRRSQISEVSQASLYPQIVLPPHLERIREKLAENIHELWALTRIEQGWTYGPVSVHPGGRSRNDREDQYLGSSGNQGVFGLQMLD